MATPDLEAAIGKAEAIRARGENPSAKEYGDSLAKLLEDVATARDSFVNWVAGLATGTMLLTFQAIPEAGREQILFLFLSGLASFACLVFTFAFKILLEIRFAHRALEISLLRTIYEGHNIRTELEAVFGREGSVPESAELRLMKNIEDTLQYLDEDHVTALRRPIDRKERWWKAVYWLALGAFALSMAFLVLHYSQIAWEKTHAVAGT